MKLYAIGDIHGQYNATEKMIGLIEDDISGVTDYKVIFLGDYVDRGLQSWNVVDHLNDIRRTNDKYVFLKGNHEDMLIECMQYGSCNDFYYNGGRATMRSYDQEGAKLTDHTEFWNSLKLYYEHGKYVFVHAGIPPRDNWRDSDPSVFLWERAYNGFLGEYPEGKFVIHGHTPVPNYELTGNQLNIDTGAVFVNEGDKYGKLTCVVVDTELDGPEHFRYFQTTEK